MTQWFASGLIFDVILAVVLIECLFLAWLGKQRGLAVLRWLPGLLAGAALLLALRLVIADAGWSWVASAVGLAGLAHVFDVMQRLQPEIKAV